LGYLYFQAEKSYSLVQASTLISVSSICGIFGGIFSGLTSDKFFHGNRTVPATIMSALNLLSLVLFMFGPTHNIVLDVTSMVLFGISIGVLIAFLGGLMAVDLVPASATGAAMGVVGIASYMGAGMQDIVSGILFESKKTLDAAGNTIYDFSSIRIFWVSAAAISLFFMLVILFVSRKRKMEHQY
jgi:Sugar phosphate permease